MKSAAGKIAFFFYTKVLLKKIQFEQLKAREWKWAFLGAS